MLSSLSFYLSSLEHPRWNRFWGMLWGGNFFYMISINQNFLKNTEFQPAPKFKKWNISGHKGEDTRYNSSSLAILLRKVDEGECEWRSCVISICEFDLEFAQTAFSYLTTTITTIIAVNMYCILSRYKCMISCNSHNNSVRWILCSLLNKWWEWHRKDVT